MVKPENAAAHLRVGSSALARKPFLVGKRSHGLGYMECRPPQEITSPGCIKLVGPLKLIAELARRKIEHRRQLRVHRRRQRRRRLAGRAQ